MQKNSLFKRLLTSIIFVIVCFYIGYQAFRIISPSVKTEMTTFTTITNSISAEGKIIRKETPILRNSTIGFFHYIIKNGERVAQGGTIAQIFQDKNEILALQKIKSLDRELKELRQLNQLSKSLPFDLTALAKQTNGQIGSLLSKFNKREYTQIAEEKQKILYLLNKRQIATNQVEDFNAQIEALEEQKQKWSNLCHGSTENIISYQSGYFVNQVDGYENYLTFESVLGLTPEILNSAEKRRENFDKSLVVGKVIGESKYYIATILKPSDASNLKQDMELTISIPSALQQDTPAKVVAINQKDTTSDAAVIFICDQNIDKIAQIRTGKMLINLETFSGLKIPKSSIHTETIRKKIKTEDGTEKEEVKQVQGVFVLCGNKLTFKQTDMLYTGKDFSICKQNPDPVELFFKPLKLYDKVVKEGVNLYDGKIIE